MQLRTHTLLLTGFLATLKNQELNAEEQKIIGESLNTADTLKFLMLVAAIYQRTATLNFLSSLTASCENIEQWITKQPITNIFMQLLKGETVPTFDDVFDSAIGADDVDYLEFLVTISPDIHLTIMDKLTALPADTKLKLTNIRGIFVALNQDIEGIVASRDKITRFARAIIEGDRAYLRSDTCDFDSQQQNYFVVLAASHQQAGVLDELMDKKSFWMEELIAWVQGVATPTQCRFNCQIFARIK